jgi:hypothetical protein
VALVSSRLHKIPSETTNISIYIILIMRLPCFKVDLLKRLCLLSSIFNIAWKRYHKSNLL